MTAIFPTYQRFDVTVEKANGVHVEDVNGKTYLDFGAGIGVCSLGHCHPQVNEAVSRQLQNYWHVSNLYYMPIQEEVAERLVAHSSGDYVFFCNSGAEANEAAIKLARKAAGKSKIITFKQSFHGRTFAAMSATGQEKIQTGYGSMLETFEYLPYNDIDAVKTAIDDNTAAVMLEIIQGEGGVIPAEAEFLQQLEARCKAKDIFLIVDEIQTGIGRTGKPFAYQHYGLDPDMITVAKALGNGLPVGALIGKERFVESFGPGSHGSTFGGNPVAMAAANAVLDIVFTEDFLRDVQEKSDYLFQSLHEQLENVSSVTAIRGKGLMAGIECKDQAGPVIQQLQAKGLLVLSAGANVIRLLPPLIVSKTDIDTAVSLIRSELETV